MIAVGAVLAGFVLGLVGNALRGEPAPSALAEGSASPSPSATSSAATSESLGSPSAAPTTTATPAPSVAPLAADSIAAVAADGLRLRAEANVASATLRQLKRGANVFVVSGPTIDGGLGWYEIAALDLPSASYGWAAGIGPAGEAWLQPSQLACPGPTASLGGLKAEPMLLWLSCLGNTEFTMRAYIPDPSLLGIGCTDWPGFSPDWLAPCAAVPVADAVDATVIDFVYVSPDLGQPCSDGPGCAFDGRRLQWVEMTVHFDDPAAATCTGGPPPVPSAWKGVGAREVVLQCRERPIVTHVQAASGP